MFYDSYERLEIHFSRTHFLCPYEQCKQKCYVAFETENELQAHISIVHSTKVSDAKVSANALLGFRGDDESGVAGSRDQRNAQNKKKPMKMLDNEGVDFSWYFSKKYMFQQDGNAQQPR